MNEKTIVKLVGAGLRATAVVSPTLAARAAVRLFFTPRRFARPAREKQVMAHGEALRVLGMHATAWGAGPTVLLVHGWEGRGSQLVAFVEPLVEAGFRVVALDGPAHGDSPGTQTNMVEYARTLMAVGTALGPFAGIVAHSFGVGATILALSQGLRADRVAVIAGPSSVEDILRRALADFGLGGRTAEVFLELCARKVGVQARELDLRAMASTLAHVPALVLHDRDDAEIPYADGEALAAAWPGARLLTTDGLGHRRILRDPAPVAAAADFLSTRGALTTDRRRIAV